MDPSEKVDKVLAVRLGKTHESLVADFGREFENPGKDRARLRGQDEATSAPVSGIGPPLNPAVLLHAIDLSNQRHRFDFEQIGKSGLIDALVAGEVAQDFTLRPGEAEEEKRPLVKASREQTSNVVNEKPKAAIQIHSRCHSAKQLSIGDNKL
jgi:hypothetical protein